MSENNQHDICVIGLGYIGLPTASMFATQGFDVLGVDINPTVVETVNNGEVHIEEPGLRTMVNAAVNSGQLQAATEPAPADVFIIAVPTPCKHDDDSTNRSSDLSYIESAVEAMLPSLQEENLVILESTSPPETTRKHVAEPLRRAGYTPGESVFVAHCPERVLPGNILRELIQNDRTVGGVTEACSRRAAEFYGEVVDGDIHRTNATTAELVKLMENTYRDVNIALANELAGICDHLSVDVTRVIELANYHPRVNLHWPGPGVGGHCLPIDPWFVIESAPEQATLIRQARLLNEKVPAGLAGEVADRLEGAGEAETPKKVGIFGVTYKGNVDDTRETPATELIEELEERGVDIAVYDPHASGFDRELCGLEETVRDADALVIASAHDEFKYLDPAGLLQLMRGNELYDFCNLVDAAKWTSAGFIHRGRGVPFQEKRAHRPEEG